MGGIEGFAVPGEHVVVLGMIGISDGVEEVFVAREAADWICLVTVEGLWFITRPDARMRWG